MIVLQASHIKKSFDTTDVLHDASFIVRDGDKVGLIGGNGAGKSTLVRIITGEEQPDGGEISRREDAALGYVAQFVDIESEMTVYEFVSEARRHLQEMEARLRRLEADMATPDVYEDEARFAQVTNSYDEWSRRFDEEGGYAWQTDIRRVLVGLRFSKEMHDQKVQSLSGGQKTRLSLARLLAAKPSLLVLDEPTNYLDTDTLTWLEQFLKGYDGSLLIVSHDRYFLDEVTNQTVELDNGLTKSYPGNYAAYVDRKTANRIQQAKLFAHQQEEIANLEAFVAKNLARASTTKRAQSRRNMLNRMERLAKPEGDAASVSLSFTPDRPSGKDVLSVRHLSVGYGGIALSTGVSFRLERGMRLAILGPNGIGKSTLLKTLLGQLPAIAGNVDIGQHVRIGYYDQEQQNLDESKTVLSHVWDEYPNFDRTTVRSALAQFLFRGEDVDKPVSGLSGGERSRLNLCRLMLQKSNTLFMDEPTNHLDIPSKEALEDALVDYEGTLLFISHDRYFIDAIATHVGVLSEDGLTLYIGNYTDYREKVAENERITSIEAAELAQQNGRGARTAQKTAAATPSDESAPRTRIRSSDVRKAQETVAHWERVAADTQTQMDELAASLSDAAQRQAVDEIYQVEAQLAALQKRSEEALDAWETASLELERMTDGE